MAGGGEVWERRRMVLSFAYLAFSTLLRLLVHGRRRNVFAEEVELLVLRYQLSVLPRQQPRSRAISELQAGRSLWHPTRGRRRP
jgi:hypothetical protein